MDLESRFDNPRRHVYNIIYHVPKENTYMFRLYRYDIAT